MAVDRPGPSLLQAGAGSFEGALHRLDARVQHVGHLVRVVSENVAQDEDGELTRRQRLECGDEGQGDGFALLVAGFRAERREKAPAPKKKAPAAKKTPAKKAPAAKKTPAKKPATKS